MISPWYLAACILVPAIWGLVVAAAYDALAARRKRAGDTETKPPPYTDFEI